MSNKLLTTTELLSSLAVQIRMSSYGAIDAGNHLATHSTHRDAMYEIAGRLGECATIVRNLSEAYDTPGALQ